MKKYETLMIKCVFYEDDVITVSGEPDDFGSWNDDWFLYND